MKHELRCTDCGLPAWSLGEDFMVLSGLWYLVIPKNKQNDVICIGCFESRFGRKLTPRYFKPWFRKGQNYSNTHPLNSSPSQRLLNRLELTSVKKSIDLHHDVDSSLNNTGTSPTGNSSRRKPWLLRFLR